MQRNPPTDRELLRDFPKKPRAPKTPAAELPDPPPCDDARCRHNCPWTGWSLCLNCVSPCGHDESHAHSVAECDVVAPHCENVVDLRNAPPADNE